MCNNSEHAKPEAFFWNELIPVEDIPERSLPQLLEMSTMFPEFIMVLPERLQLQIMAHANDGVMREPHLQESPEPTLEINNAQAVQEQAGILIGSPYRDPRGFLYTVVTAVVAVDDAEATLAQVKLRASSWPPIWRELQKDRQQQIVGWYHSHPGYGIFLSATDRLTQSTYFSAAWQIALVVDPIREEFGAFAGTNPERLHGSAIILI